MTSTARPSTSGRSNKWPTHMSICADLILGLSQTEDSVHEVDASFGSSDGTEHSGKLNMWSRDTVGQGLYLATNVAVATHPLRLSVSDTYNLRFVPETMDGTDPDMPCLPPGPTCTKGTAIVTFVSEDRKTCVVMGFTYLNKTHQWQKFKIRLVFEATIRWEPWTCPPVGTMVDFEALITGMDAEQTFEAVIRRLSSIEANTKSLQQALQMSSPSVNRAALLRQARAAGAAARGARQSSPSPSAPTGSNGVPSALIEEEDDTANAGPSTPPARKNRRLNPSA